ncbi:MAG: hypothetical protein ACI976_001102, partial [Aureispira sp.]
MILKNMLLTSVFLLIVLLGSCNKDKVTELVFDSSNEEVTTIQELSDDELPDDELPDDLMESIDLGVSGQFEILSKAGITNVYQS